MSWKTHGKSIAMGVATLLMAILAIFREVAANGVTPTEWVTVAIAGFTTGNVWLAANVSGFEKAKTLVGALGLVLSFLTTVITGGISGDEWLFLALQFGGALGVAGAPAVKQIVQRTVVSR